MIGLLDPRLGGLWASLTWVHCVHSVLQGNTWLPRFPSSPTIIIIREVLECGFLSINIPFGVWATHPVVPSKSGTSSGGLGHRILNQDLLKINSLEIIKSKLYTVTPFLEFPFQVIQMQTETQQNLQKEMQKMHQKFKAREDKSKKEHREEMGQVILPSRLGMAAIFCLWCGSLKVFVWLGFLCCISNQDLWCLATLPLVRRMWWEGERERGGEGGVVHPCRKSKRDLVNCEDNMATVFDKPVNWNKISILQCLLWCFNMSACTFSFRKWWASMKKIYRTKE